MIIPSAMEKFIKEKKVYQVKTEDLLLVECSINNQYGETVFAFDNSGIIRARFAYCEEIGRIESILNTDNQIVRNNMKELIRLDKQVRLFAKMFNYIIVYAEPQKSEAYCWIDLLFKVEDWNDKNFMACWNKIESVKRSILEIKQKYIEEGC